MTCVWLSNHRYSWRDSCSTVNKSRSWSSGSQFPEPHGFKGFNYSSVTRLVRTQINQAGMCLDGFKGVRADAQDLCTSALRGPADKINHRLSHRSLRLMLNLTEEDSSIESEKVTRGCYTPQHCWGPRAFSNCCLAIIVVDPNNKSTSRQKMYTTPSRPLWI